MKAVRPKRIIVYPKDIQRITGKGERYSRMLLKSIKTHFNKEDHQVVSVEDLSKYLGLKVEEVEKCLI